MIDLYNGDCLEIMKNIPSESVDLIVADPPYLIKYKTGHRKDKNHKFCKEILNDDNFELVELYIKECYRIMKNDTAMYMFCNYNNVDFFKKTLEENNFNIKNMIVWVKNNWSAGDLSSSFGRQYEILFLVNKGVRNFNGSRLSDVWFFDRVVGNNQLHQNQKPLKLIERCIQKYSNDGDLVFDGFMGSGTTGIACKNLNRNFIGVEMDDFYFRIAKERIENGFYQEDCNNFETNGGLL